MKRFFILFFAIVIGQGLWAQSNIWKVSWDMNAPIGQTADFVSNFSFRGVSLDASWFVTENVALGASIGWGLFYEKTEKITETHMDGAVSLTGKRQKYNNFVPLLFNAEYYFLSSTSAVRPFIGLGIGASWSELMCNVGLYQAYEKNWMFTLAPEVGIIIPIVNNFNAFAKVKYLQGFWKDGNDLQSFTISVGFAFATY